LNSPVRDGTRTPSLSPTKAERKKKGEKKKDSLFHTLCRKEKEQSDRENAEISGIAKKKGKKKQAQICNIKGLYLLNSALPSYNCILLSTAMGPTLGAKICDAGVAYGIAESRGSPLTIKNRTINAIHGTLKSVLTRNEG